MFAASETTQRVAGSTVLRGTGFDTPRPRLEFGRDGAENTTTSRSRRRSSHQAGDILAFRFCGGRAGCWLPYDGFLFRSAARALLRSKPTA
jgi:hypothetical protein